MADIFESNHRCYGYRRMRASLSSQCMHICEKVVLRLMKQEHLIAATPKRRRYGSYLGEISPAPEGDVIVTGTPGGVGAKRTPPVWMKAGDVVEIEVDAIGILRNGIRAE